MPRSVPAAIRWQRTLRAAAAAVAAVAIASIDPAATPAGGEPTPATDFERMPGAARRDVVRALQEVRRQYGEDAVRIETQLLLNALRQGSLLAAGVRVEGVNPYRGERYLGFVVETGMIFDDRTRDLTTRLHMLWLGVVVPTLERLTTLTIPADGIKVALQYHHRRYASRDELRASIEQPGTSEEAIFYVLTPDVTDLAARRLSARDLIAKARIAVNGKERVVELPAGAPPTAPGPE